MKEINIPNVKEIYDAFLQNKGWIIAEAYTCFVLYAILASICVYVFTVKVLKLE
jgi:hypothetical protein